MELYRCKKYSKIIFVLLRASFFASSNVLRNFSFVSFFRSTSNIECEQLNEKKSIFPEKKRIILQLTYLLIHLYYSDYVMLYIKHPLTYNNHSNLIIIFLNEILEFKSYLSFDNISFSYNSYTCPIKMR